MARVEKITVTCDGPCGGNEIVAGAESTISLRPKDRQVRNVDLCPDCAGPLMELYGRGSAPKPGRPAAPRRAATSAGGSVNPSPGTVVSPSTGEVTVPLGTGASQVLPQVGDPFADSAQTVTAPIGMTVAPTMALSASDADDRAH